MKVLHQPPAELREAEAMAPAKRARKRNFHRRSGYGQFKMGPKQLRDWINHRASSKITSTVLPAPVS